MLKSTITTVILVYIVNADSILPLFTGLNLPVFVFGIIQN